MQVVKLNPRTLAVLKNFASINASILFRKGNTLSTISTDKSVMARATIPETFESSFAIYDLSRFLGAMSLFEEPELHISDSSVLIKQGRRKINYVFADPAAIMVAPDKELKLPSEDIKFTLNNDIWVQVQKALGALKVPNVSVNGDGTNITLNALDAQNPTGDVFSVEVGDTTNTFTQVFKAENLRMIAGDYEFSISKAGISKLTTTDLTYYVAVQKNLSIFEE